MAENSPIFDFWFHFRDLDRSIFKKIKLFPKNAPNPNAALFFANWLLSAETQTAFNTEFGTAPLHKLADDSNALIPNSQRAFRTNWAAQPFRGVVEEQFVENVILER